MKDVISSDKKALKVELKQLTMDLMEVNKLIDHKILRKRESILCKIQTKQRELDTIRMMFEDSK